MLTRADRLKAGQPLPCKKHGIHFSWRIRSDKGVTCTPCAAEYDRNSRIKNPIRFLLKDAKGRKLGCNLDEAYIEKILVEQQNRCALSGVEFTKSAKPSLDRINSKYGYLKGNVQLLLGDVNKMKMDLDQDWFLFLCHTISKHKNTVMKKNPTKPTGNKIKTSPPVNQKGTPAAYTTKIKNAGKKK